MSENHQLQAYIQQLHHPNYRVRNHAAFMLGTLGDSRAIEPLLNTLGDFDAQDEASKVNMTASTALVKLGEPALHALIRALKERRNHPRDGWRRYWVADTLGYFQDRRAISALIEALQEGDREVVEGAAEALGQIGDLRALEPLTALLQQRPFPDGYVYTAIAAAIKRIHEQ